MSNQRILFALASMGTPLSIATGECPWRPYLTPLDSFCVEQFRLGSADSINLSLKFSLVQANGIANAKADIFGVTGLLSQVSIIVSLHPETSILEMQLLPRNPPLRLYIDKYIPWTVSKYGWYLGENGNSINTGATLLDMSIEGISFPATAALAFLGTKMATTEEEFVWIHPDFIAGQELILNIANDRSIRIPLRSLCTQGAPDLNGYQRCHITIRSVRTSTAHVFIGETLLQHVNRVKLDHYGDMEMEEMVVVSLAAPIQSASLRHLPIFHPPVPHTDMWGDSTLRLYPARYAMPANSRLKGVVIPKGPYDFHYIGPAREYDSEYEMAGPDRTPGPWVRVYTLEGFYLEKKLLTDLTGIKSFSLVSELKGGRALKWSIQAALCTTASAEVGYCVICQEPIVEGATVDECKHWFHLKCLREWANKEMSCPLCRRPLVRQRTWSAFLTNEKNLFRNPKIQTAALLCYLWGVVAPATWTMLLRQQVSLSDTLHAGVVCLIAVVSFRKLTDSVFQGISRLRSHSSGELTFQNLPPEMVEQIERWIPR